MSKKYIMVWPRSSPLPDGGEGGKKASHRHHAARGRGRRQWPKHLHRHLRPSRRRRSRMGSRSPTSRRMSSGRCWNPETPPFKLPVLSTRTPPPTFAPSRSFFFSPSSSSTHFGRASISRSGSCPFLCFLEIFWRRHLDP